MTRLRLDQGTEVVITIIGQSWETRLVHYVTSEATWSEVDCEGKQCQHCLKPLTIHQRYILSVTHGGKYQFFQVPISTYDRIRKIIADRDPQGIVLKITRLEGDQSLGYKIEEVTK